MLKRVGNRELSGKTEIFIKEASFPVPFQPGLEFNSPVHGNWNIVHTGMLVPEARQIYVCADNCMRGVVLTAAEMNAADRFSFVIVEEKDLLGGNLEDVTIEGVTDILNRLDEIIMFKPLTKDNIGNIINLLMNDLNKRLADREITVELSDSARQFIVDHGYDPIYGARPLKRFLQKHVETLSAKLILADEVREGDTILIDTEGDKLTARVK